MRKLTYVVTRLRQRLIGTRSRIIAPVMIAAVLFTAAQVRGRCDSYNVYLGSSGSGYTNVNADLMEDIYGNIWVSGYDGEPPFEIVIDYQNGQVLDPYGDQIGIVVDEG